MSNQKNIWQSISETITPDSLSENLKRPSEFQLIVAGLVDGYCDQFTDPSVAEIGCETGISLMLVNKAANKTFLDFDDEIIEKLRVFCAKNKMFGRFVCEDMFNMKSMKNGEYDIVFNAGVIEHYGYMERVNAINEYARILKKNGIMIIAYPNHYSYFYRFAYLTRRALGNRFWPWPEEKKIYNLKREMEECGLAHIETKLVDKVTTSVLYGIVPIVARFVKYISRRLDSESYLRVCVAIKNKD